MCFVLSVWKTFCRFSSILQNFYIFRKGWVYLNWKSSFPWKRFQITKTIKALGTYLAFNGNIFSCWRIYISYSHNRIGVVYSHLRWLTLVFVIEISSTLTGIKFQLWKYPIEYKENFNISKYVYVYHKIDDTGDYSQISFISFLPQFILISNSMLYIT